MCKDVYKYGVNVKEFNKEHWDFVRGLTKREIENLGKKGSGSYYSYYKCKHCGEVSIRITHTFKENLFICKNECNGVKHGRSNIVLYGYNDLATTHPQLAKEWHPTKNGDLKPNKIASGTHDSFWWQCKHGHEWEATAHDRIQGNGCPYCSNRKVVKGFNDVATTHPYMVVYFPNIEDAHTHTYGSGDEVDLIIK